MSSFCSCDSCKNYRPETKFQSKHLDQVYDLIPANIYLFKVNNRNTKKGVKYV